MARWDYFLRLKGRLYEVTNVVRFSIGSRRSSPSPSDSRPTATTDKTRTELAVIRFCVCSFCNMVYSSEGSVVPSIDHRPSIDQAPRSPSLPCFTGHARRKLVWRAPGP